MIENYNKFLKSKEYPPILILFGEEDFLVEEAYTKLINSMNLTKESSYDFETFNAEDKDVTLNRIIDSCSAFPFVSERRIVAVKHFEKLFSGNYSKKTYENTPFDKYIKSPQATTFLIIIANNDKLKGMAAAVKKDGGNAKSSKKVNAAKYPYNILLAEHKWIEFPKVYESSFHSWVSGRLKSKGKNISPEACEFLIAQSEQSLRTLQNEVDKLVAYAGNKEDITIDDVSKVVGSSRVYNIFELQKAIGKRDLPKSMEIVENMLATERQEMLIMTMLARYFLILWKLIEESRRTSNQYELAGKVGVAPFFVPEYLNSLRNYTVDELDNAFIELAEADEKLKSSSTDGIIVIQNMLLKIMDRDLAKV